MPPRTLFKEYGDGQKHQQREEIRQTMSMVTQEFLIEIEKDSIFFQNNSSRSIPFLEPCGTYVFRTIRKISSPYMYSTIDRTGIPTTTVTRKSNPLTPSLYVFPFLVFPRKPLGRSTT